MKRNYEMWCNPDSSNRYRVASWYCDRDEVNEFFETTCETHRHLCKGDTVCLLSLSDNPKDAPLVLREVVMVDR